MDNFVEYIKGTAPLHLREEVLFDTMDRLDRESFQLFNQIVDFDINGKVHVESLINWLHSLLIVYNKVDDAFEYLNTIELESYEYAAKRFQLKRTIAAIVTIYSFLFNAFIGIASFILLNNKANKDFALEMGEISENIDQFDEEKLNRIKNTLANCERLLNGKMKKSFELENQETLKRRLN